MKDNKLIAEFMELEVEDGLYYYTTSMDDYKTDTLYFNSSWDWLMPVVAKISRDEKYFEDEYREYILDVVPYGHIDDVFDAVINFIKQIK
jgi:hypothetical protein